VWTGADALSIGLVDELGGLDRAMALAVELTGAPPGTRAQPKWFPPKQSGLARLRRRQPESSDDLATTSALYPADAAGRLRAVLGRALGSVSNDHAMLRLGSDERRYWIP